MTELQINIDVALKSGAKVTLTEYQNRIVKGYVEKIVLGSNDGTATAELLPPVSELKRVKKYRRRFQVSPPRSFTAYEDGQIATLASNPAFQSRTPHAKNPARVAAIKQLAKEQNRSVNSILSRMWKLAHPASKV